jgi:hypothetical protein
MGNASAIAALVQRVKYCGRKVPSRIIAYDAGIKNGGR